jgi:hypothetical protein
VVIYVKILGKSVWEYKLSGKYVRVNHNNDIIVSDIQIENVHMNISR